MQHARSSSSELRAFFASEASGGLVLMVVAAAAFIIANSMFAPAYFSLLNVYAGGLSVHHWINDGLMAVFFLLVGLEIKREFLDGQLATWPHRVLPGIAAAGGVIIPALIFMGINFSAPVTLHGWAIPAATDIAFALGVLALLGPRVPISLKVFLTAVAIIDDLAAVAIIAVFYTTDLSLGWMALSVATLVVLAALNRFGVERIWIYLALGAILWFLVLKSGVHASLAGAALAFTVPLHRSPGRPDDPTSPLHRLEHALHPWVAFLVVPIFGFANAGVSLSGMTFSILLAPLPLGIAAGLFLGKQVGVFLSVWIAAKLNWAKRPHHTSWAQMYGISLLCGIGFTMSLFIGLLAFPDSTELQNALKVGVLGGSILSALTGALVLIFAHRVSRVPVTGRTGV